MSWKSILKMPIKQVFTDALLGSVKKVILDMPTGSEIDFNTLMSKKDEIVNNASTSVDNKYRGGFTTSFIPRNFENQIRVIMLRLEKQELLKKVEGRPMTFTVFSRIPRNR